MDVVRPETWASQSLDPPRIAWVYPWDLTAQVGVWSRTLAQIDLWRSLGYGVELLVSDEGGPRRLPSRHPDGVQPVRHFSNRAQLNEQIASFAPGIIYQRYVTPSLANRMMSRHAPVVLDFHSAHTDEVYKAKRLRQWAANLASTVSHGWVSGAVVVVPDRLSHPQLRRIAPKIAITNGILLKQRGVHQHRGARPLVAIAIANDLPAQGVGILARLADATPEFTYLAITPSQRLPRIARVLDGIANVKVVQGDDQEDLERLLRSADVGLGSLGVGSSVALPSDRSYAPLKVRSYAQVGLPCVLPYRDADLGGLSDPAILDVPTGLSLISEPWLSQYREFVAGSASREMLETSRARVDLRAKEATRLGFFGEVAQSR